MNAMETQGLLGTTALFDDRGIRRGIVRGVYFYDFVGEVRLLVELASGDLLTVNAEHVRLER